MKNYDVLRTEIAKDRYLDKTTDEIVDLLNADSGQLVSRGDITRQMSIELLAAVIVALLQKAASDPTAAFWLGVYDRLVAPIEIVHTHDPFVINMMDSLVAGGYMTSDQHDAFLFTKATYWQIAVSDPNECLVTQEDVSVVQNS